MTPYVFSYNLFPQRPFWVVLKVLSLRIPRPTRAQGSWEVSGCGLYCVLDLIAPLSAERRVLRSSASSWLPQRTSAERLSLDGFSFKGVSWERSRLGKPLGDRFFWFLGKCWGQLDHERARKLLPWTSQREAGKEKRNLTLWVSYVPGTVLVLYIYYVYHPCNLYIYNPSIPLWSS